MLSEKERIIDLLKEAYPECEILDFGIVYANSNNNPDWDCVTTVIDVVSAERHSKSLWTCTFVDKSPLFYDDNGELACGPTIYDNKWKGIRKDNFLLFDEG